MKSEEIRKWKRSALAAVVLSEKSKVAGRASSYASAAALWEIALQLAIHNERENGVRRLDAGAVHALVREAAGVARQNQRMLRHLLSASRKSVAA